MEWWDQGTDFSSWPKPITASKLLSQMAKYQLYHLEITHKVIWKSPKENYWSSFQKTQNISPFNTDSNTGYTH